MAFLVSVLARMSVQIDGFFWNIRQLYTIFFTTNNWIRCLKFCEDSVRMSVCLCVKGLVWMTIISYGF